jgi:hypothetical protein
VEKGSQTLKIEEKNSNSIDYSISFYQNDQQPIEFKFTTRVIYGAGG